MARDKPSGGRACQLICLIWQPPLWAEIFPGPLGSFLGESQSTASSGLSAVLPALIGGLVNKGSTPDGASSLLSLLNTPQVDSGIVGSLGNLFANGGTQASGSGHARHLVAGHFVWRQGRRHGPAQLVLWPDLKSSTASSMLGLVVPIVLGMIKSHANQNNLGASGLMELAQRSGASSLEARLIRASRPPWGFPSVAGLLGLGGAALHGAASAVGSTAAAAGAAVGSTATAAAGAARAGAATAGAAAATGGSALMKWLPWIVGAAVILWALSGMRGCGQTEKAATPAAPAVSAPAPAPAPAAATPAPAPAPAADATKPALPLAKVYFDSGKFEPPADLSKMLDEMVVYARANANSKLSISGFHDKTGDPAKNAQLAKDRGMAVKNALISAGVPEDRIMMQKPVETTGGGDDKEARRVEVSVAQ